MARDRLLLAKRYIQHEQLGSGGMGAVYRATDLLTGEIVAIKRVQTPTADLAFASKSTDITDEDGYRRALVKEFHILAGLHHPNIISVLDFGFDAEGQPFYTMQYLANAEPILEIGLRSSVEVRLDFLLQTLQALAYLHRRGILHRDLKSSNVLVQGNSVRVLDFGLSVESDKSKNLTAGTMTYMAPELLARKPSTELSDLYAVGMLAYQLFSGQYPFPYRSISELYTLILTKSVNYDEMEVSPPIRTVVRGMMAKNPANRFPSAEEAIKALCAAQGIILPSETRDIRESFLTAAKFIGRENELARLKAALEHSQAGRGEFWLVGGESGVGKSRLLDELRIHALTDNVWVIRGQDVPTSGALYHLWREPLRRLVLGSRLSDSDALVLREFIPDIETLLGHHLDAEEITRIGNRADRIHSTLVDLLRQHRRQPILLLLEDLQWSRESLDLLQRLIPLLAEMPILVVGSYREDECPTLPDLLNAPEDQIIHLERLTPAEIEALSSSMLGKYGRDPRILDFIQRETEGNVLFIVEVLRILAEEAGMFSEIVNLDLPDHISAQGISAIIQRRLQKVEDPNHLVLLKMAAVLGRELDLPLLETMAGDGSNLASSEYLRNWLATCANLGILELDAGRWQFAHDKLREGLLEGLSSGSRQGFHRMAAEAIEQLYPQDERQAAALCRHWKEALHANKELHYLRIALERATRDQLYPEMVALGKRGLELVPPHSELAVNFLRTVGDGYTYLSDYELAQEAYNESLRLADELQYDLGKALCLRQLALLYWEKGEYVSARARAAQSGLVAKKLGDQKLYFYAIERAADYAWLQGEYEFAEARYEECHQIAQALQDDLLIANSLNNLAQVAVSKGDYTLARQLLEESLSLGRKKLSDQRLFAFTLTQLGMVAGRLGETTTALRHLEDAKRIERKIGNRAGLARAMEYHADILQQLEDYSAAKSEHIDAVELRRRIKEDPGIVTSLIALAFSHLLLRERHKAHKDLEEALAVAHKIHMLPRIVEIMVGFAWIHLLDGRFINCAELLGMLQKQRTMTQDLYHTRLVYLYDQLRAQMPNEDMQSGLERGYRLDFETEVQKLLPKKITGTATPLAESAV